MRHLLLILFLFFCSSLGAKKKAHIVRLETTAGVIRVELSDETPLHRDNFLKLCKEGYYDSTLFHRVIKDFMIQGGDPDSKDAASGVLLGDGDKPYTVPAEFRLDKGIFHHRGVLAAAREGDLTYAPAGE